MMDGNRECRATSHDIGYVINMNTGVISCTKKHDGLRVVAKSK